MKKGGARKTIEIYAMLYGLVFAMSIITVGISLAVFILTYQRRDDLEWPIFLTCMTVLAMTGICTVAIIFLKRKLVDNPVEAIIRATDKIAAGDFNVKLNIRHEWGKFDDFDLVYENINAMAQELSKTEILRSDFVANVSHEIKTPLAVIRNYASLLSQEEISPEKRKEYIQTLKSSEERLTRLVTNILKLNKLEHQKLTPESKRFNLSEKLVELIINSSEAIDNKGIELETDIPDNVFISSDASLCDIIFSNLLSNAIKFTPSGGKISVRLYRAQKAAFISFVDTGCGMTPQTGEHIFEKFYQGDTSHSQEGNGLGLAMVKRAIDLLGGNISVESQLGKGSAFTVKLRA